MKQTIYIGAALVVVIVLLMWLLPKWNVYSSRLDGEAQLAHALSAKEVAVATAKAQMESSQYLRQADSIRAEGIAAANKIIANSITPQYLQWKWIDELSKTSNQIIYVPAGQMGLPILEANRLKNPKDPLNILPEEVQTSAR